METYSWFENGVQWGLIDYNNRFRTVSNTILACGLIIYTTVTLGEVRVASRGPRSASFEYASTSQPGANLGSRGSLLPAYFCYPPTHGLSLDSMALCLCEWG